MLYVEDINSKALLLLNKRMIDLKKTKEFHISKKLLLVLTLCKKLHIKELLGLIYLSFKKDNNVIDNDYDYVNTEFKQNFTGRVAVYTCIFGSNDVIEEPLYISDKCDYFIFTDRTVAPTSEWKKYDCRDIHFPSEKPNEKNRFVKLHPHIFFQKYDYSLYIDGNIIIVTDVLPLVNQMNKKEVISVHKHDRRTCAYIEADTFWHIPRLKTFALQAQKQMKKYEKEGFPRNYGLFENSIILRRHNSRLCISIMDLWWEQLVTFSMRDQISLPYVLWKLRVPEEKIHIMGTNLRENPRFIQKEH